MKNKLNLIAKITTTVTAFLLGIAVTGGSIMLENAKAVNDFFGIQTQIIEWNGDEAGDTEYYKSAYDSVKEVQAAGAEYCRAVEAEGATLLKNQGALPLGKGARVSLFSYSSVDVCARGYGSGAGANATEITDLKTALADSGVEVNPVLWNWYGAHREYRRDDTDSAAKTVGMLKKLGISDAPWSAVYPDTKDSYEGYSDAAIFVLSRSGGENADMKVNTGDSSDMTDGNYLKLSPSEISVLKGLKSLKGSVFKKIIVLMNTPSAVECEFADNEEYGIDALLWIGLVGSEGTRAVGDILTGAVNPSGRLSDTFWKYHYKNPVLANFGSMKYADKETSLDPSASYVVYQEGIYNGYRYAETRYEDFVTGAATTGAFDYAQTVSYPFGYGLSYTSFEYSDFKTEITDREGKIVCSLSVDVTNAGEVAGKETVQFYVRKPYTDYDVSVGLEKSAAELVGFGKTELLQPGETQTVTAEVDGKYLASYDAYGYKTYILEKGTYYFTAAKNAHEAVNNILAFRGYESDAMTSAGDAAAVCEYRVERTDAESYAYSSASGEKVKITNRFDDADLKIYEGAGENADAFEYVSRSNWAGTVRLGYYGSGKSTDASVKLSLTERMISDLKNMAPAEDDVEYPVYGSENTSYNLIDLRAYENGQPIEYDNPMWEDFLDQLTWSDTVSLLEQAQRTTVGLASVAKPATVDHNGSNGMCQAFSTGENGLAQRLGDPDKDGFAAIYPCSGIAASTFNIRLMKEYGRQWGEDCLWAGYSGLYGPSVNLHRSPYCGRSFEYFSEDPFLSGYVCAALTDGIGEKGVYVYLKHCVLNDQETDRHGIGTWANEQTIRELYLRPFEIAIEEGGAACVMTGFNRIGTKWTGAHGFVNTVLRAEFGMSGMAISDNPVKNYMTIDYGVLAGNDIPDYSCIGIYNNYEYGYGELAWAMRESAHRILYTVVHSNAMNGFSANTRVKIITPAWVNAITVARIVIGVLLVFSAALLVYSIVSQKIKERRVMKNEN